MKQRADEDIVKWIKRWNFHRLLEEKHIRVKDLALQYDCTPEYLHQLLRGDVGIGAEALSKLAGILNVEEQEFVRTPPELGGPELDEIYRNLLHLAAHHDHLKTLNETLELLLETIHHGKGPAVIGHLRNQLILLKELLLTKK